MPNWNAIFTKLIRERDPRMWGNWALASTVKIGSIGILRDDGGFVDVDTLQNFDTNQTIATESWRLATNKVTRTQAALNGSVSVPTTPVGGGVSLGGDAETKIEWTFEASDQLISEFNVSRREGIKSLASVVAANKAHLESVAASVGMRTAGSIDQGFGFIAGVIWAKSGSNVAALTSGSKFSISGRANLIASYLGLSNASASVSGSYARTTEQGDFDTHLWPAEPSATSNTEVPIAYLFSSFEGSTHLPGWIGFIQNIVAEFKNVGSYIAKISVKYTDSTGLVEEDYDSVSGGLSRQVILPLDATNIQFTCSFVASDAKLTTIINSPLSQSSDGRFRFRIGGFWPSGPTLTTVP